MIGPETSGPVDSAPSAVMLRGVSWAGGAAGLDTISTTIQAGEQVAVIGPPGSGTSALLRLLAAALDGWSGTAILFGRTLRPGRALPRGLRTEVGLIPHAPALVERATVFRNVMNGRLGRMPGLLSLAGRFRAADAAAVTEAIEEVGLAAHAAARIPGLSEGQRQRVAIARCLAAGPSLILADEPADGPDPIRGESVLRLLSEAAARRGATLVFTCRQAPLAQAHAGRILALRQGRVMFDGPAEAVSPGELARLYGGEPGGPRLRRVV